MKAKSVHQKRRTPRGSGPKAKRKRTAMVKISPVGGWLGWLIAILLALWFAFGSRIISNLAPIFKEPITIVETMIEGAGWLRVIVEIVIAIMRRR